MVNTIAFDYVTAKRDLLTCDVSLYLLNISTNPRAKSEREGDEVQGSVLVVRAI